MCGEGSDRPAFVGTAGDFCLVAPTYPALTGPPQPDRMRLGMTTTSTTSSSLLRRAAAFAGTALATLLFATGAAPPVDAQRANQGQRVNPGAASLRGGVPGRFDYYALSLSWSPSFCAETQRGASDPQCNRSNGRPYAFVLHGLWPQYERGYPDSCPTEQQPFVPNQTIDRMLDIMPSRPLIIHEYRKHGVCSGLGPDAYFDFGRKLFHKVKIPARFVAPANNQMVDTNQVIGDFVAANPGLRPDMLGVVCGGSGNRLREVRICMSREGEFRACGSNENQRRLCNSPRVFVPPIRVGAGGRGPAVPAVPPLPPAGRMGERSL